MKTEISSPITVCALSRTDVSNLLFVGNYAKDQQILLDDYFQFSLHLSTNFSCFYCWKPSNVIFKKNCYSICLQFINTGLQIPFWQSVHSLETTFKYWPEKTFQYRWVLHISEGVWCRAGHPYESLYLINLYKHILSC